MILEYLERLRTRPMHERRRFALGLSASLTAIIAVFWGTTLPARLQSLEIPYENLPELETPAAPSMATDSIQGLINGGGVPQQEEVPAYDSGAGDNGRIMIATSSQWQ